jgi:F0F1-type ATP synthase assembly protein I
MALRVVCGISDTTQACDRIDLDVPENRNMPPKPSALVTAVRYTEIGFVIPAAIFLGYVLGRLADYWLHTRTLYLAGVIFGAIVGFVQMIRMASALSRDNS